MVNPLGFSPLLSKWIAAPWNSGIALQLRRFPQYLHQAFSCHTIWRREFSDRLHLLCLRRFALSFKEKNETTRKEKGRQRTLTFLGFQSKRCYKWDQNSKTCAVLEGVVGWSQTLSCTYCWLKTSLKFCTGAEIKLRRQTKRHIYCLRVWCQMSQDVASISGVATGVKNQVLQRDILCEPQHRYNMFGRGE